MKKRRKIATKSGQKVLKNHTEKPPKSSKKAPRKAAEKRQKSATKSRQKTVKNCCQKAAKKQRKIAAKSIEKSPRKSGEDAAKTLQIENLPVIRYFVALHVAPRCKKIVSLIVRCALWS
ncbi:hypothetical protein TURU_169359 [Turdus rufiventris]|nr:hypothetical protein TURU_169359 [Turdus rufiventris]